MILKNFRWLPLIILFFLIFSMLQKGDIPQIIRSLLSTLSFGAGVLIILWAFTVSGQQAFQKHKKTEEQQNEKEKE